MKVHPVVIATAGNQRYIFASNKRRENVGGSFLITCVEEGWLDHALTDIDADRNGRIGEQAVEIVTANAGGITALVNDAGVGRRLVASITGRALREAPGLDVCGVVGEAVEWEQGAVALAGAIGKARGLLPMAGMARPGPQLRFPGLPIAARCASSGLPAHAAVKPAEEGRLEPRSAPSAAKLDAFEPALKRLAGKMGLLGLDAEEGQVRDGLWEVVRYLADQAEWVAVVHADGNGLGQVFQGFNAVVERLGRTTAREYVDTLSRLSEGVDDCAEKAFGATVEELTQAGTPGGKHRHRLVEGRLPLLPLVLGGDDLTVICDGALALPFTERYLTRFARLTRDHEHVGGLLGQAGRPWLGACAGIAIVKRHYPFHSAADLAEALTKEAKAVKDGLGPDRSALSFHVLYESAVADLARLRRDMTLPDGTRLTAQPYIVGEVGDDPNGWSHHRHLDDLRRRVEILEHTDTDTDTDSGGERLLPGGQAHELRSGLFLGRAVADARFSSLAARLSRPEVKEALEGETGSLFWRHDGTFHTGLLDAMNAAGFLPAGQHQTAETPA